MPSTRSWKAIEAGLIDHGVRDDAVLDAVRRATAPARHAARVETVRVALTAAYGACGAFVAAALDVEGAYGPFGMGGPGGCSARVPALRDVPRHQQAAGGAWDAAVAEVAATPIGDGFDACPRRLAAHTDEDGPAVLLVAGLEPGAVEWDGAAVVGGIDGEALAGLAPWLRAQAARAALHAVDPECPALRGLAVPGGSPEHWADVLHAAEQAAALAAEHVIDAEIDADPGQQAVAAEDAEADARNEVPREA